MMKILKSPSTIFASIIVGFIIGVYFKSVLPYFDTINKLYLSLMSMTATPVVICNIIINVKKVCKNSGILKMLILFSAILMVIIPTFSLIVMYLCKNIVKPSDNAIVELNKSGMNYIVDEFVKLKLYDDNGMIDKSGSVLKDFIISIVPNNIFESLTNNHMLQIILFCIIFGSMLPFIKDELSANMVNLLEAIYQVLNKFISYIMIFMPISLLTMAANISSDKLMVGLLTTLLSIVILAIALMVVTIVFSFIIICICTQNDILTVLKMMKNTIMTAIGTASGTATTVICLKEAPNVGIDQTIVRSILPITTYLCSIGVLIQSVIVSYYVLVLYDIKMSFSSIVILILGSILFSISTVGVSTQNAILMFDIILTPLGLPINVAGVIYIVVGMFCKRLKTFCKVYPNLAVVALLDRMRKCKKDSI